MVKHVKGSARTKVSHIFEKQVQPNAVELTVGHVYRCKGGTFFLEGDDKRHLEREEILPEFEDIGERLYDLPEGVYIIEFEQRVEMGESEVGVVISRSTLMRNGVWMTSALYDSGYRGGMTASLSVPKGVRFVFPKKERLAQFVVMDAEALSLYEGSYQDDGDYSPEHKEP